MNTPLVTALIGATVVFSGSLVAHSATRYAAELQAAQRRRNVEIAHLAGFCDALVEALTAFSTYKHMLSRVPEQATREATYERAVQLLEQTPDHASYRASVTQKLERLRNLARGLLWSDLRDEFRAIEHLIFGSGNLLRAAMDVDENADLIDAFAERVAAQQRQLLAHYPVRHRAPRGLLNPADDA